MVTIAFPTNHANILEGNSGTKNIELTVSLSAASAGQVTAYYTTTARSYGSAMAGGDYTPVTGSVVFAPGEMVKTISIPIVGDTTYESNENFYVDLTEATGAIVVANGAEGYRNNWVSVTINNDDRHQVPAPPWWRLRNWTAKFS